ncbi:MAG: hypothetical protein COA58_12555 [Bacteroidetes bacterium]|nr:MAG: hypothetical protein COA58_12555 [Bacteroidota bacterium]
MKNLITAFILLVSVACYAQETSQDLNPRVVFGELKHDGPYDRSEILLQERLSVSSGNGNQYKVVAFKMILAPKKGGAYLWSGKGEKLTPKMQTGLNKIEPGDKIIIESVLASVNGDSLNLVELEPIILEIKTYEKDDPYINVSDYKTEINNIPTSSKSPAINYLEPRYGDINPADLSTEYTLEDILAQTELNAETLDIEVTYTVTSFKMILAFKNDDPPVMISSGSNKITTSMKERLAKVKSGDRILIEGIRAVAIYKGEEFKVNLSPMILNIP